MHYFVAIFLATFVVTALGQQELRDLKTEFFLYTKGRPRELLETRNPGSILSSSFDPCRKTVLLITGYRQVRSHPNTVAFVEALAAKSFNVILVDFFTLSYILSPMLASMHIARFLKTLVHVTAADPKHINLVGISLGAHIAGQASRRFRVGRIAALDPAGPIYESLPDEFRVDQSDADFVEAVHSAEFLGSIDPYVGHVNFVINTGVTQPGCEGELCAHLRAAYLYLASVDDCVIRFRQCGSYMEMVLGLCWWNPTLPFGFSLEPDMAPRAGRLYYYLSVTDEYPFCRAEDVKKPTYSTDICSRRRRVQ